MVAVGKVVFTSREHIIALEARDKGMLGVTLRYPYEVRKQADYFDDIKDEKVPKDMLDLALHIVETKRGDFEPAEVRGSVRTGAEGNHREKGRRREDRAAERARAKQCRQSDGRVAGEREG